jgi:RHS repeat-associated protein
MLASDHKNTVFSEVRKDGRQDVVYTAYGDSAATGSIGYNGERRETQTGWYLLGNGYRAYNPGLMRFHSPDSLSPFGEGGVNAYAYTEGDPVNYTDPTGNAIYGFGWLFKLAAWIGGSTVKTGTKVGRATSAGSKVSKSVLKAPKGKVNNGNIKGGYWEQVNRRNEFTPIKQKPTSKTLANPRRVTGPKAGDSLGDPSSGLDRLQSRLQKDLIQTDVIKSHQSVMDTPPSAFRSMTRGNQKIGTSESPSMFTSTMEELGQGGLSRSKEDLESVHRAVALARR